MTNADCKRRLEADGLAKRAMLEQMGRTRKPLTWAERIDDARRHADRQARQAFLQTLSR